MKENLIFLVLLLIVVYSTTVYSSVIYKCTEAKGHVTFSDSPCGKNVEVIYEPTQKELLKKEYNKKLEQLENLVFSNRPDDALNFARFNNMKDEYYSATANYINYLEEQHKLEVQRIKEKALARERKRQRNKKKALAHQRQINKNIAKQKRILREQKRA